MSVHVMTSSGAILPSSGTEAVRRALLALLTAIAMCLSDPSGKAFPERPTVTHCARHSMCLPVLETGFWDIHTNAFIV
jgi:hypothetical protein